MTSLYSLDITLVLFHWIIKQIIRRKKYLVTVDWSQSEMLHNAKWCFCMIDVPYSEGVRGVHLNHSLTPSFIIKETFG